MIVIGVLAKEEGPVWVARYAAYVHILSAQYIVVHVICVSYS